MTAEHDFASICRRLDALILIALESGPSGAGSTTRKIEKLVELGFSQPEIAQIIGKKLNYVTAVLSQKRGAVRKKKAEQPEEAP
jgi:hypothetical protein